MARERSFRVLDHDYPPRLRDLEAPPDPLWVRGELLAGPAVAIVGTRAPAPAAVQHALELAARLARAGASIWSGGAVGIDAAAHRGALDAGGHTVAVVGTGLDHCYPREHRALYEEIVSSGGALVSPFERRQHATLATFPRRNAALAALTHAAILVQAPHKSGARSAARHARRLGRPLFVVPAPPWDTAFAGNLAELALGAAVLVREVSVLRLLGLPSVDVESRARHHAPGPRGATRIAPSVASVAPSEPAAARAYAGSGAVCAPPARGLPLAGAGSTRTSVDDHGQPSAAAEAVLAVACSAPLHADDFCAKTGLSAALVQEALLTLTLKAVLVEGPGGWFRLASV